MQAADWILLALSPRKISVPRNRKTIDDLLMFLSEPYDQFAKRAGVARFTLFRLRQGLIATPRRKTLHALAAALDLDVSDVAKAAQASYEAAQKG